MDAVLGAIGQRDIGTLFPDTDQALKVWAIASGDGWRLQNADMTLLAEAPKVKPYVAQMIARIAGALATEDARITIKATTTEKLGFVGRQEGVVATAVVLLSR
jgi:2-C-methyl-D-erythritol 4-phosphate cytidylyltransferase/2-C-methyl-D-erythritol 2,4-cyclodiphosphate synthase